MKLENNALLLLVIVMFVAFVGYVIYENQDDIEKAPVLACSNYCAGNNSVYGSYNFGCCGCQNGNTFYMAYCDTSSTWDGTAP